MVTASLSPLVAGQLSRERQNVENASHLPSQSHNVARFLIHCALSTSVVAACQLAAYLALPRQEGPNFPSASWPGPLTSWALRSSELFDNRPLLFPSGFLPLPCGCDWTARHVKIAKEEHSQFFIRFCEPYGRFSGRASRASHDPAGFDRKCSIFRLLASSVSRRKLDLQAVLSAFIARDHSLGPRFARTANPCQHGSPEPMRSGEARPLTLTCRTRSTGLLLTVRQGRVLSMTS